MKYTEQQLLQMLQDNIEEGAAALLEEYTGLLWSVCRRRLDNEEDIRECVNSTFAEFCLHMERFDIRQSSLKNYLCRIADRRAVDCWRKNIRKVKVEEAVIQKYADDQDNFENMTADRLEEALSMLPTEDEAILRMKYYENLSYQEIAERLGLNYETVKKRGLRGRKKLMNLLLVLALILALLAACAIAVLHHYKFTGKLGFIWSGEDIICEVAESDAEWTNGQADFQVTDAVYRDGALTLYLTVTWNGNTEDMFFETKPYTHGDIESGYERLRIYDNDRRMWLDDEELYPTMSWFGNIDESRKNEVEYKIHFRDPDPLTAAEELSFSLYFDEEEIGFLQMKPVKEEEFQARDEQAVLSNGAVFTAGPGRAGTPFATVILLQTEEGNDRLSGRLYSHIFGLGARAEQPARLTDKDGNVYTSVNVTCTENPEGLGSFFSAYQFYFPGAEAGEYTLCVPQICVIREGESEEVMVPLPKEEGGFLECDITVMFPQGAGLKITGVHCAVDRHQDYNFGPDGTLVPAEEDVQWRYTLETETITGTGAYQFCTAEPKACIYDENGEDIAIEGVSGASFEIKYDKAFLFDSIPLKFVNPVFVLEESISLPVIIEESE